MTYQQHCTITEALLEEIAEHRLAYLPELVRIEINSAMEMEGQRYLQAGPNERTESRVDRANGFKPKTVATRMGKIEFAVPQARAVN